MPFAHSKLRPFKTYTLWKATLKGHFSSCAPAEYHPTNWASQQFFLVCVIWSQYSIDKMYGLEHNILIYPYQCLIKSPKGSTQLTKHLYIWAPPIYWCLIRRNKMRSSNSNIPWEATTGSQVCRGNISNTHGVHILGWE